MLVVDFFLATTMQKHRSELATVNVTIKLVGLLNKAKNKGCLVVLHRPPLIFENWKKFFTVQKYTAPNFENSNKVFFFENFDPLKIFFKLLLSTCLHSNTGLKLVKTDFLVKQTYLHLYWEIQVIIPCSSGFDLKKETLKKQIRPPAPTPKQLWMTTKQFFFRPNCILRYKFARQTEQRINFKTCFVKRYQKASR